MKSKISQLQFTGGIPITFLSVDDYKEEINFYNEQIQTHSANFEREVNTHKEKMQDLCDGWAIERERNNAELQKYKENLKKLCKLLNTKDQEIYCAPFELKAVKQEPNANEVGLPLKKKRPPDTRSGCRSKKE